MGSLKAIIIAVFLSTTTAHCRECSGMFIKYEISPHIKSSRGWDRVIKKKKLHRYIKKDIEHSDANQLEKCLVKKGCKLNRRTRMPSSLQAISKIVNLF